MSIQITLNDLHDAYSVKDPTLSELIVSMASQLEPEPKTPIREGAPTFQDFVSTIKSYSFTKKKPEEKAAYRMEQMKILEAEDAEVPLSDKIRMHEFILKLWEENSFYCRQVLMEVISKISLVYGPWRALKRIYKEAEERGDSEIFGALAARFDMAYAGYSSGNVSNDTLGYLVRRGWRYLRRIAETLPATYADVASDFLIRYQNTTQWNNTWIANHIFKHETKKYSKKKFKIRSYNYSINLKERAYADLWKRSPEPLFALLERAQADKVREFAIKGLETDYRSEIRDIEATWIPRLIELKSGTVDEFVVWVLNNVPRFEQAAFRELGFHDAILKLFDSASEKAQNYVAEYARTHARDLSVYDLILLMNNRNKNIRKLAEDLLRSHDPRKDVGLASWQKLLDTSYGYSLAEEMIKKHFGAKDLTLDWFKESLLSSSNNNFNLASSLLEKIYPIKKVDPSFFTALIEEATDDCSYQLMGFALDRLEKYDINTLDTEFLKKLFVHTNYNCSGRVLQWLNREVLKGETLPLDFYKIIAYEKEWKKSEWVKELKASDKKWAHIEFNESLSESILNLLADVRRFSAADLGFEWLMMLVKESNLRYHNFAVKVMNKTFSPADFAESSGDSAEEQVTETPTEINVDFSGLSFLFTGKMATMVRKEAEANVRNCGGSIASGVNGKLSYLVIGDDGSSLYGNGKKGSKQVKAEKFIEGGSDLKIISETAFLKMLTGKVEEASSESLTEGCQRLWEMLTEKSNDESLHKFALKYFRSHHNAICMEETDRPVDEDMQIPAEFLTFEQVKPLFTDSRKELRDLALDVAKHEFGQWNPPVADLIALSESSDNRNKTFVYKALFPEHPKEKKKYYLDASKITSEEAYLFCKSRNEATREIGITLIQKYPNLRNPQELFNLTESSDRGIRSFAIRALWDMYRSKGVTKSREAFEGKEVAPQTSLVADIGGKPKAGYETLFKLLRTILFELPAAKLHKNSSDDDEAITVKPLSSRKAKLSLIEVLRDVALEDGAFAKEILPLFIEFMESYGKSEQAACLVAVTRIQKKYPELKEIA